MHRSSRNSQDGYALMVVMFFLALLTISVTLGASNIITDQRRLKEEEMVWRGQQYVRGINLYYRKMHRLPSQLEDLYEPKTGNRFMRRAYKDPMNELDGTWRLITVGPNGRIIGSLRKNQNMYIGAAPPANYQGALGPSSAPASSSFNAPNTALSSPFSSNGFSSTPSSPAVSTNPPSSTDGSGPAPVSTTDQNPAPSDMSAGAAPIPGPNPIIGVGSKINKKSILWLDGEKNYLQFEFVWSTRDAIPH